MSGGDGRDDAASRRLALWLSAVALAVIFLGVVGWGALDWTQRNNRYPEPRSECAKARNCDEKTLQVDKAQAAAADSALSVAFAQLALSLLGLGGVGFTVCFAGLAWREAKRSADAAHLTLEKARADAEEQTTRFQSQLAAATEANRIAQEAAYAAQRAWLEVVDVEISSDLKWNPEGARIAFTPKFRNIGNSPALGAVVQLEFYFDLTADALQQRAEMMTRAEVFPMMLGNLVFPRRPLIQQHSIEISRAALAEFDERHREAYDTAEGVAMNGKLFLKVIGCVSYRTTLGPTVHHTAFILDLRPLSRADDGDAFDRDVNVPKAKMRFQRTILGDIVVT